MTRPFRLAGSFYAALSGYAVICLFSAAPIIARPISPIRAIDETEKRCEAALDSNRCPIDILPACEQATDLAKEQPGNNQLRLAKMLLNLGLCLRHNGKFVKAETATRQSLHIRRKLLGPQHIDVAESLDVLALVLRNQGKYAETERLHRLELAILERHLGSKHPDIGGALNNLAVVLGYQGKYAEAESMHRRVLTILQEHIEVEHPRTATAINNLAMILRHQGKYAESESLYRQSLAMRQKLLGKEHLEVAISLNNLSSLLGAEGKYAEAELLSRQALFMRQKLLGAEHPNVASSLTTLANLLHVQGKYADAEVSSRWALAMRQKLLGTEHPDVAASLVNLAQILYGHGAGHREAEPLLRRALAMQQKLLGPEHPDVATSLNTLAILLRWQGKYVDAEFMLRRALAIRHKLLGTEHPDVAINLGDLAWVLMSQGRYAEAEPLYRQALDEERKLLGRLHPAVAISLDHVSALLLSQSRPEETASLFQQTLLIREQQIRAAVSETRVQALFNEFGAQEDAIYGLTLGQTASQFSELAMRVALLWKGRTAEAGALANRLIHRSLGRPEVKRRFDEWTAVRQQREFLLYRGLGKISPAEYQKQLEDLLVQAESLEHALAADVPEIRNVQPPPLNEIIAQVAQRLPQNGVLLEVVSAKPFQGYGRADKKEWGPAHFIALLLFPDQHIVTVDLGEAERIDTLVEAFRRDLASPRSHPEPAAQALYAALFDRLLGHLAGRHEVFLSLDESLNLVPFDALHDGTGYLLGRYRFHYLTTGRDLLRKPPQQRPGPALVLGNPDFGLMRTTGAVDGSRFYSQFTSLPSLTWGQREAETVARLLGVQPLLGAAAKEETLRGDLAPRVLHIATHGIFLSDLAASMMPGAARSALIEVHLQGSGPASTASPPERLPGEFGPMNRSALLFAGVRQAPEHEDKAKDGLLTAEEARSLNLDGTQLVVLSACDTGIGTTERGQGVYGLRRAFLIAGAETVVTSLWRVSDQATSELMTSYYQRLLAQQKPADRLDAMIESMKELRARPGRSHPYYWAPFLVIGADGPLRVSPQPPA